MTSEFDARKNILFVCTGNTCRSPMAAAIFNNYAEKERRNWFASSAGIAAESGLPISKNAELALKDFGITIEDHNSNQLDERMLKDADVVLTMTTTQRDLLHIYFPGKKNKIFTLAEMSGSDEDLGDPFGQDEEKYRAIAERLVGLMPELFERLTDHL